MTYVVAKLMVTDSWVVRLSVAAITFFILRILL